MTKSPALLLLSWLLIVPAAAVADPAIRLVEAARAQIGTTLHYDGSYQRLAYPNGDLPAERGVCTDVVIRALRTAHDVDLQRLVHRAMRDNFAHYPQLWGLQRPDRNIDHRRVPNLQTFFRDNGWALPVSNNSADYRPGDIVTSLLPPHLPHIMIVSDRRSPAGRPLVIHNIGAGTREEDRLFDYPLTGHYRLDLSASVLASLRTGE